MSVAHSTTTRTANIAAWRIRIERRTDARGRAKLVLTGELDAAATENLRRSLLRATGPDGGRIQLDLSGVEFIDSSCVEALIEAQDELSQGGIRVAMARASDEVWAVLRLAGAEDRFRFG